MSVGLIVTALEVVAPSLLTGIGGVLISHLQNPLAARVIKLGKGLARGNHLSKEEKQFIHEYNKTHGVGSPGYSPWDTYR